MARAKNDEYSAKHLAVLEGLDAVRKRPGMYIGSTDSRGLMHCLWEIVDNSVDEALAGFAKHIDVVLHPDGSVDVRDDGRGMDPDRIRARHVADSLQLLPLLPGGDGPLADLGSGGGFPGLVLAMGTARPVHLVESDRRKAAFLTEAAAQLDQQVRPDTGHVGDFVQHVHAASPLQK